MMGYTAPSKAAIKRALKGDGDESLLDFRTHVQETSFFGLEAKVPGDNLVVGPDAYTRRNWYGSLTVDETGRVTAVR